MSYIHSKNYEMLLTPLSSSPLRSSTLSITRKVLSRQKIVTMTYPSFKWCIPRWFPVSLKINYLFSQLLLLLLLILLSSFKVTLLFTVFSCILMPCTCQLHQVNQCTELQKLQILLTNTSERQYSNLSSYVTSEDFYMTNAIKPGYSTMDNVPIIHALKNNQIHIQNINSDYILHRSTSNVSRVCSAEFDDPVTVDFSNHNGVEMKMQRIDHRSKYTWNTPISHHTEMVKSIRNASYPQEENQTDRCEILCENYNRLANEQYKDAFIEDQGENRIRCVKKTSLDELDRLKVAYPFYQPSQNPYELTSMMLTSHINYRMNNSRYFSGKHSRIYVKTSSPAYAHKNRTKNTLNLHGHSHTLRMDQKRILVVDHPSALVTASKPVSVSGSIYEMSRSSADEFPLPGVDRQINEDKNKNPILSFEYVEPHTVDLLVVVTERMKKQYGPIIKDYLLSTMTTVSTLLRHPSLKTSIQLSIVDIILLDPNYARRHNLEDWLNSKQEQVMARFCKWVNRLRRPNFTWDSAILLNVGHFKSTALGVAHYRSMCNPESSCLAVLDRGFGTGHIIAHELGHQLGAKHDFELNSDCGLEERNRNVETPWTSTHELKLGTYPYHQAGDGWDYRESYWNPDVHQYEFIKRDTIMSGTLYFDNFPLRWSACSRQAIHTFIESNAANCLRRPNTETVLYSAEKLASQYVENRPGRVFSLNRQCEFVLKIKGTQFCGQMLPVCRQLYCQDSEHKSCLPVEAAWAEGTPCGNNKWCIQGQCIPTDENPTPIHGGWGEWGSWSACSRSCGGGVQYSERECNNPEPQHGGDFCHGTRTRMRSCGTEMCEKEVNIRQTLCDQIDGPYKGQLRAYFPKLGEPTSCNLICLYNSHSVPHSFTLPDGTPCYSQRDDICIQGKCWETGCDGILGSRLRFDRCRVCGGDNSTCEEVKGVFNGNAMTSPGVHLRGLITAVRIPRGVTNAFVRKVSDRSTPYSSDSYDDFMLLIFEELKTQIRRGETREPFAGAELYYSGSRSREEIVSITGRLNKDVNIVIRVENTHTTQSFPTVEYSYFVDKSQQNNSLYFVAEKEAQLAAERVNRRTGRSQNAFASFEESERLTPTQNTAASEVERHQAQQEKPQIYFVWRISELPVGCTTCAGNVTTHAECYPLVPKESDQSQFSEFDLFTPVADYLCSSVPRPPPVLRRCSDYCGVRWTAKPAPIAKSSNDAYEMQTSSCSARCGEGHQAVVYVCEEYIVPAGQKDKSKGTWRVAQLGEFVCQKAGLGSAPSQPAYIACQGSCYPVYWILSNWTKCTNSCGNGKRKRSLHCQDQIGQNWPLSECLTHSESSLNQSNAPRQAITTQSAIKMIEEYQEKSSSAEYNLFIEESIDCLSLTDCRNDIVWFTSDWSECEPLDEKMKSTCRLIDSDTDQQSSVNKIIGVHYRNVSCVILDSNEDYHPSLNEYIESEQLTSEYVIQGKKLNMEFCRKASILGELIEEPIDREACSQPACYRWGLGQMTSCSVTCGTGIQHIKIPCERIQLKYESDNLIDKQIVLDGIDTVSSEKCLQSLQYIPRLSTDKMNSTVYVETIERQIHDKDAVPLKIEDINEPIVLPCEKDPCNLRVPAWRTTSWSSCSTSCGLGVKERKVMCVMETVDNTLNRVFSKQNSQLYTSIFIARRSDVEIVDAQKCHAALLPKPIEQETCLQAPCPIWITGDWQECQGVCEYGIQRRQVRCVIELGSSKKSSNNNNSSNVETDDDALRLLLSNPHSTGLIRRSRSAKIMDVDQERCRNVGVKPISERPCLITGRCPYWYKSEWSECSVTCGMGTRSRQVDCRFPNGTQVDMEPLTDSQIDSKDMNTLNNDSFLQTMETIRQINTARHRCHAPRPIDNIACKTRPCKRREVFWWSVTSSECHVNGCELGKRERIIKCINPRRGPVHDSVCNHLNKPLNWTVCELFKCKTFQWVTGPWSTCPETCASRMRYRQVKCVDDLGNEYSESLCPQNLRPNSWSICPNLCSDVPKSCRELKHRYPSADDGTYHLLIEHSLVYIYCADMETTNPSEYITLRQINYAGSSEFLQPYPNTNWCPAFNETISTFNTSENMNQFQSNIDTIQEIPESLLTNMQVNVINCPNCPSVPNLASKTFYHKIRLDIYNLEIKIDDTRFSHTVGSSIMPYATAKDCFSSTVCPQGQFQIDLRGTGFHVSVKTHWSVSSNTDGISHIFRSHNGQVIRGHCGGKCTGCWPQPGLFLDLLTDQISNQPVKLIKTP